jgi:hypothetical protein
MRTAGSRRMRCQARQAWPRASVAPSAASQLQPYLALTRSLPLEEPHDRGDVVLGALLERGGDQLLRRRAGCVGARACSAAALQRPHTHNHYVLLTCCKHAPCCCHRGPVTPAKALPSCPNASGTSRAPSHSPGQCPSPRAPQRLICRPAQLPDPLQADIRPTAALAVARTASPGRPRTRSGHVLTHQDPTLQHPACAAAGPRRTCKPAAQRMRCQGPSHLQPSSATHALLPGFRRRPHLHDLLDDVGGLLVADDVPEAVAGDDQRRVVRLQLHARHVRHLRPARQFEAADLASTGTEHHVPTQAGSFIHAHHTQ